MCLEHDLSGYLVSRCWFLKIFGLKFKIFGLKFKIIWSKLWSDSLILWSHPDHILRVSVHLQLSISLLAISQAITHIGRCKSIAYRDCLHTKGRRDRIVHSQSCTWSVHMHMTRSPLNLDRSVCIACIYNKSMRSLTQRYIYTRLRMNRLKCWSSYVWIGVSRCE